LTPPILSHLPLSLSCLCLSDLLCLLYFFQLHICDLFSLSASIIVRLDCLLFLSVRDWLPCISLVYCSLTPNPNLNPNPNPNVFLLIKKLTSAQGELQLQMVRRIREDTKIPFNIDNPEHFSLLKRLWAASGTHNDPFFFQSFLGWAYVPSTDDSRAFFYSVQIFLLAQL
jgi:hypothetical protein